MSGQRTPKVGEVWTSPSSGLRFTCVGAIPALGGHYPFTGQSGTGYWLRPDELAPPRPKLPEITNWWANVYPDKVIPSEPIAELADRYAGDDRIARVPLVPDLERIVWCNGKEVLP